MFALFSVQNGFNAITTVTRSNRFRFFGPVIIQKAWSEGYSFLTVDVTNMSKPILEKIGFEKLGVVIMFKSPED